MLSYLIRVVEDIRYQPCFSWDGGWNICRICRVEKAGVAKIAHIKAGVLACLLDLADCCRQRVVVPLIKEERGTGSVLYDDTKAAVKCSSE
jgi:hypothetical protein